MDNSHTRSTRLEGSRDARDKAFKTFRAFQGGFALGYFILAIEVPYRAPESSLKLATIRGQDWEALQLTRVIRYNFLHLVYFLFRDNNISHDKPDLNPQIVSKYYMHFMYNNCTFKYNYCIIKLLFD